MTKPFWLILIVFGNRRSFSLIKKNQQSNKNQRLQPPQTQLKNFL